MAAREPADHAKPAQGVTVDPSLALVSPVLKRLLDYWNAKRGQRPMPARADILPSEIKELLPAIILFDVIEGGRDFRVRLVGSGIRRVMGWGSAGWKTSEATDRTAQRIALALSGMLNVRKPLRFHVANPIPDAIRHFEVEFLTLPLSSDGTAIDMALCGCDLLLPDKMGGGSAGNVAGGDPWRAQKT